MGLPQWPTPFLAFCLLPLVQAYTVFETNCSAPVTQANYVASPNTRGTLDILWSSLFTIFACTWTLQHPNVPKQRAEDDPPLPAGDDSQLQGEDDSEGEYYLKRRGWVARWVAMMRDKWSTAKKRYNKWINATWKNAEWKKAKRKNIKWALESFYRSTLRMVSTIFAPEVIIAVAFDERMKAAETLREMKDYARKHGDERVTWSLRHSYYANMGGFVIRLRGQPTGELPAPFGPFAFELFEFEHHLRPYHHPYHLTGKCILALREREHISKLPDIKEAEIQDKSKGDILVKLIALGQIVWSMIQIIARAVRRLPVSPLEVAVTAYAICAVIIYATYWEKPQRIGVAHTIQLTQKTEISPRDVDTISFEAFQILEPHGRGRFFGSMKSQPDPMGAPISMDSIPTGGWLTLFIAGLFAVPFGAIHAAAWNFAFPSTVELMLWRWVSIYMTAAPLCAWLLLRLRSILRPSDATTEIFPGPLSLNYLERDDYIWRLRILFILGSWRKGFNGIAYFFQFLVYLFLFLYVLARLFIFVEMFRTLCFLPSGSYISTWTTNMPHLA